MEHSGKKQVESLFLGLDLTDPLKRYRGQRIIRVIQKLGNRASTRGLKTSTELAIEVYHAFFIPYPLFKHGIDLDKGDVYHRYIILSTLINSEAFHKARMNTIADPVASTVAASIFLHNLIVELQKQSGFPGKGNRFQEGAQSSMINIDEGGNSNVVDEKKLKKAVEESIKKSVEPIKTAKEVSSLVKSFASGSSSVMTLEDSIYDIVKMAEKTDVRLLLDNLSGFDIGKVRFSRIIESSSRGEVIGLETGTDLERLHISQLALPEILFLAHFANQDLLLYEKGLPARQGPVYVLLDKSGSMTGRKMVWAKTVALALFKRAVSESRWFMVRFFDSVPYPLYRVSPRAKGREIVKLIDYIVRVKPQGGTDISRAVRRAAQDVVETRNKRMKPGDIVLITDGEDRINPSSIRSVLSKSNLKLVSVMIGGHNDSLRTASDYYMRAYKLSEKEALKVIYYKTT